MALDSAAYSRQIKQLFPRGRLWNFESNSNLSKFISAIATEFARIDSRCEDFVEETDPRTTSELISEWELMVGIIPDVDDLSLRRLAVTGGFIAQGGSTAAYLLSVATGLGFVVDHVDYPSHDTMILTIDLDSSAASESVSEYEFCAGSNCGNNLYKKYSNLLENVINKIKPAHVDILFYYAEGL